MTSSELSVGVTDVKVEVRDDNELVEVNEKHNINVTSNSNTRPSGGESRLQKSMGRERKSWGVQLSALTLRELKSTARNQFALMARFGVTIFQALLYALMFNGAGMDYSLDYSFRLPQVFY